MAVQNRYEPTQLIQMPSKGNYWFVIGRKPQELRVKDKDNRQRLSTKTRDKRQANLLWRSIEAELYALWDSQLTKDPFIETIKPYWDETELGDLEASRKAPEATMSGERSFLLRRLMSAGLLDEGAINRVYEFLSYDEALKLRTIQDFIKETPNPYPLHIQQRQVDAQRAITVTSMPTLNSNGCPTILDLLPAYMEADRWRRVSLKEKKYAPSYIRKCVEIIGDKPIDQIIPKDAVDLLAVLHGEGRSTATIGTYKRNVSNLFTWAKIHAVNKDVVPNRPWITGNPFYGLSIKNYGKPKRNWEALGVDQLHDLFTLEMPKSDRLLLSILITTGMRLDEAALLEWDQYKVDRNGLRYFDLSLGAIVKTDKFSARTVAMPDCLELPQVGTGRLFDFRKDDDGKSSRAASKHLNEKYLHKIRYNKQDDRKAVHSLRHNLSGLILNLTNPPAATEHMNWITGHGMEGSITQSERQKTYNADVDVQLKYNIVNRIEHPWLK